MHIDINKETIQRYIITIIIVMGLSLLYRFYQSYQNFEWINIKDQSGKSYAIPGWKK